MSNYFSSFPTVSHDLENDGSHVTLTNILRRFKFRTFAESIGSIFYDYEIQYGDRPDILAEKYYGDGDYAWVILHFNGIQDVRFDWPLFNEQFENFIRGKYGSVPAAQAQVKAYYYIQTPARVLNSGVSIQEKLLEVDLTTYNSLDPSRRKFVTAFDWEEEQNELKRNIKILDERYLEQINDEVTSILRG